MRQVGGNGVGGFIEAGKAIGLGVHEVDDPLYSLGLDRGRNVYQHDGAAMRFVKESLVEKGCEAAERCANENRRWGAEVFYPLGEVVSIGFNVVVAGWVPVAIAMAASVGGYGIIASLCEDLPSSLPGMTGLASAV